MPIRYARAVIVLFVFVIVDCGPPETPQGTTTPETEAVAENVASQQLQQLFADEWSARLSRNPLFASRMDVADYNDRLPDMSPDAQQRNLDEDSAYLARLDLIDREALSQDAQ